MPAHGYGKKPGRPTKEEYLTMRWTKMRPHLEQHRYWSSQARFKVVPAGRRSGKCLAEGSMITMAGGTYKPVEQVQEGDYVWSMNPKTYRFEPQQVKHVLDNGVKETLIIKTKSRTICCTDRHPFLIKVIDQHQKKRKEDKWLQARKIHTGQLLAVAKVMGGATAAPTQGDVRWEPIEQILPGEPCPTYDLTVEHHHNFLVEGAVTHNTELAKRKVVMRALDPYSTAYLPLPSKATNPRYFLSAPIWSQAKRIFWQDVKSMIPEWAFNPDSRRAVSESEMCIHLKSGAEIWVIGMDKPERIEGTPWDGGVLDEYGNMKARTWPEHVRPALADREGWCDFIGVPEGRNHYWDLAEMAKRAAEEARIHDRISEWDLFHWFSADVLSPQEVESARNDLDPLTFKQEMEGQFIYFQGRVYYPFEERLHCRPLKYSETDPLIFCFDFNISPGVAVVCQEQQLPGISEPIFDEKRNETYYNPVIGTGVIGEVYIPRNSNTVAVCNKLLHDWGQHQGDIHIYGDATGGAGGSAQTEGSDWDIVRKMFHDKWKRTYYFIPTQNPRERVRVNALNSRLMSTSGVIRILLDRERCPYTVKDLEGVRLLEGGSGEIDKKADPYLSHLTDGLGYYIAYRFPVEELVGRSIELLW